LYKNRGRHGGRQAPVDDQREGDCPRDGTRQEEPIAHLVPGDVVELSAGDMIPADVRLISCKDFFLTQASLTGEAFPVEKFALREEAAGRSPWN